MFSWDSSTILGKSVLYNNNIRSLFWGCACLCFRGVAANFACGWPWPVSNNNKNNNNNHNNNNNNNNKKKNNNNNDNNNNKNKNKNNSTHQIPAASPSSAICLCQLPAHRLLAARWLSLLLWLLLLLVLLLLGIRFFFFAHLHFLLPPRDRTQTPFYTTSANYQGDSQNKKTPF
ncbi:unnamed protein product [Polarella glacialis]|uniref:Uncharacterized protein n=1 Tax=Polarella glacialis TaxID=89957 RepID=A0A813HUR2_POLGL|nr:unnamed protein product [Polarella glacialis]